MRQLIPQHCLHPWILCVSVGPLGLLLIFLLQLLLLLPRGVQGGVDKFAKLWKENGVNFRGT
jgi:hypothetical protein